MKNKAETKDAINKAISHIQWLESQIKEMNAPTDNLMAYLESTENMMNKLLDEQNNLQTDSPMLHSAPSQQEELT